MNRIIEKFKDTEFSHIVPDIETLSVTPNALILSIGAVAIHEGEIVGRFYINIDTKKSTLGQYDVDSDTEAFWQSEDRAEAWAQMQDDQVPLSIALLQFAEWIKSVNGKFIWGYGSDFDNVIIRNSFTKENIQYPIKWAYQRCLRTLCCLFDIFPKRDLGTHHNALHDAVNQSEALVKCLKRKEYLDIQTERLESLDK